MCKKRNIYTMPELCTALQTLFNRMNAEFFGGELEKVVITVKEGAHKHAYGWITVAKGWTQGKTRRHEINIASDSLDRPIEDVAGTLLHEMVHLYNMQRNVQDTSRGGCYHNGEFKTAAEAHHMEVEKLGQYGFARTRLDEYAREWIQGNCPIISFRIYQGAPRPAAETTTTGGTPTAEGAKPVTVRKKSSTRKLVCPHCGNSVRATKDLTLICGDCMKSSGEVYIFEKVPD